MDLSWTVLAHKRLIIYACLSNVLNRKNVYDYTFNTQPNVHGLFDRSSNKLQQPQAFYIGFFLTLGKNVAYEASQF